MAMVHPQFDPVVFSFGVLSVHWYGLMYLLAFATAYGLASYRSRQRLDFTADMVSDLVFYGAMGVILGGRIGYVLLYNWGEFLANPAYLFLIWEGGMSFHGGFMGVLLAMIIFAIKYKKAPFVILDFIAPCVPLGLFFGRIGNFINGELWGRVSDGGYDWLMYFPQAWQADQLLIAQNQSLRQLASLIGDYSLLPRHPSQLYQALTEGLLLFVLLWWFGQKPRPRYAMSAIFLLGYGISRFITEFFRQPDAGYALFFGWMSKGQLFSLPMIFFGVVLMVMAYQKRINDWQVDKFTT